MKGQRCNIQGCRERVNIKARKYRVRFLEGTFNRRLCPKHRQVGVSLLFKPWRRDQPRETCFGLVVGPKELPPILMEVEHAS